MFLLFIQLSFSIQVRKETYVANSKNFYFSYFTDSTFCENCASLIINFQNPITNQTTAAQNKMYGFHSINKTFFYLGFLNKTRTFNESIQIINETVKELNLKLNETDEFKHLIEFISNKYDGTFFLTFKVTNNSQIKEPFYTTKKSEGILYFDSENVINFTSNEFDEHLLYSEAKFLNEISISFMFSATILWICLIYTKYKKSDKGDITYNSLFMHLSFENSYSFILLKVSESYPILNNYYKIAIDIILIRNILITLCISYYKKINGKRTKFMVKFIVKFCIMNIFYAFIYWNMFLHSYLYITVLYSFSIPQIIKLYRSKKKRKNIFVINFMSIVKLIPIYYFTCHRNNLLNLYSSKFFIWIYLYVSIQIGIITLQKFYGGNLIILKTKLMAPYNYDEDEGLKCPICYDEIKDSDEKLITPCLHCFHRECLQHWMQQRMVCPVCRNDISILN